MSAVFRTRGLTCRTFSGNLLDNCIYKQLFMTMNRRQQEFLDQLAARIPRLFAAIAQGNVKSEFIIGVRCIENREVRLKLVAEVVDPGQNPLATHSSTRTVLITPDAGDAPIASKRRRPRKR